MLTIGDGIFFVRLLFHLLHPRVYVYDAAMLDKAADNKRRIAVGLINDGRARKSEGEKYHTALLVDVHIQKRRIEVKKNEMRKNVAREQMHARQP